MPRSARTRTTTTSSSSPSKRAAAGAGAKKQSRPQKQQQQQQKQAAAAPAELPIAARRHPLVGEIARQLVRCGLPLDDPAAAGKEVKLVIGCSGGPDSLALLLGSVAVARQKRRRGCALTILAAHVNHHLRPSADEDAAWTREVCQRFGIELSVEDVYPGELEGNVAANARLMRYEALLKIAKRVDARFVAVGHHGHDQLETLLMAIGRGAGLDGLTGMPWVRPLWQQVMLIRPLLGVSKDDCLDFCNRAGLAWREDPTNVDAQRLRARLRRDVVPVFEELWPDVARRVTATAEVLEAAREAFERELDQTLGPPSNCEWDRITLAAMPVAKIAAGLRRAALVAAPGIADALNQRHLLIAAEAIRASDRKPHYYHWPGGLELKITARRVTLYRPAMTPDADARERPKKKC